VWGKRALWLLWALAVEVDEHQATRTGEQVCRACSGSGEVIVAAPDGHGARFWMHERTHSARRSVHADHAPYTPDDQRRIVDAIMDYQNHRAPWPQHVRQFTIHGDSVVTAPCDGDPEKTRPVTISLARMVRLMATLGDAPYGPLPPAWEVRLDTMEQAGWLGVDGAPAWVCRWWRAFSEWSIAGEEPDVEALVADLAERTRARRERAAAARARAFDDAVLAAASRFAPEIYGAGWTPSRLPECEFGDFGERWRCEYRSGFGLTLVVLSIVDGGRVVGIESVEVLTHR